MRIFNNFAWRKQELLQVNREAIIVPSYKNSDKLIAVIFDAQNVCELHKCTCCYAKLFSQFNIHVFIKLRVTIRFDLIDLLLIMHFARVIYFRSYVKRID
jgi:hypothetical protein